MIYTKAYTEYEEFNEVFQQLKGQSHANDANNAIDYHLQNGLLYKLEKLCVSNGKQL